MSNGEGEKEVATTEKKTPVAARRPGIADLAMSPKTFEELWGFCTLVADSDLVPKEDRGKPGQVLAKVQFGNELGIPPMQSLQTICVINGRPSVWGDGALAVVRAHPLCEWIIEIPPHEITDYGECTIKRRDQAEPITRRFTKAMAEKAKLWTKPGPWQEYPMRMLQMRARSWALRDGLPEALRGMAITEEVYDYEITATTVTTEPVSMPQRKSEALREPAQTKAAEEKGDGHCASGTGGEGKPESRQPGDEDGELQLQR